MKNIGLSIVAITLLGSIVYGVYWIGKTVSYSVFYEDMVEQTVKDMVKKSCIEEIK